MGCLGGGYVRGGKAVVVVVDVREGEGRETVVFIPEPRLGVAILLYRWMPSQTSPNNTFALFWLL